MKSEERHKLQQNELADHIAKIITALKPYQNVLFAGAIVLLVTVLLFTWWQSESRGALEAANTDFSQALSAQSTAGLAEVLDDYRNSRISPVAAVAAADIYLNRGTFLLFKNKATANHELQQAVEMYHAALELDPEALLRAQALYGLARAEESLGHLEKASKYYEQVIDDNPRGVFAGMARRRWEDLKRGSIRELYDKFAKFDPPQSTNLPGVPGQKPEFDFGNLPPEGPIYPPLDPLKLTPGPGGEEPGEGGEEKKPEEIESEEGEGVKTEQTPSASEATTEPEPSAPTTPVEKSAPAPAENMTPETNDG